MSMPSLWVNERAPHARHGCKYFNFTAGYGKTLKVMLSESSGPRLSPLRKTIRCSYIKGDFAFQKCQTLNIMQHVIWYREQSVQLPGLAPGQKGDNSLSHIALKPAPGCRATSCHHRCYALCPAVRWARTQTRVRGTFKLCRASQ